jgi:DNA-binding IscR family transcriptional regulator
MNSLFRAATRLLAILADATSPMPSSFLAAQLDLDPSRVRQIQLRLAKAGLTCAQLGPGGGAVLARSANDITLADVYRATSDHPDERPVLMQRAIVEILEEQLTAALSGITIANLTRDARRALSRKRKHSRP